MKSIFMQKAAHDKPFKIKRKRSFRTLFYKYQEKQLLSGKYQFQTHLFARQYSLSCFFSGLFKLIPQFLQCRLF